MSTISQNVFNCPEISKIAFKFPPMSNKFQKCHKNFTNVKCFQSKAKPRNFIRQEVKPRIFDSFEYQEAPEIHEPKRKRPQMVLNHHELQFLTFFSSSKSKKASCRAWNFAKQKLWDKWKILRRLRRFLFRKIMIMVIWILKIQIYYRFFWNSLIFTRIKIFSNRR